MSGEPVVRVLVVDDQRLIRESIASLLDIEDGISVAGVAANGREAVEQAEALAPDVILMDVRMPELDGVQAVAILSHRVPACRVVMLTTFDDEEYVVRALRSGAAGYLLKDLPARDLARAVRLAHAGVTQLDSAATARLAEALTRATATPPAAPPSVPSAAGTRPADVSPAAPSAARVSRVGPTDGASPPGVPQVSDALTSREIDVLRLVALGWTNREIASRLYVSEGTVKNHISRILTRLGLRDRTQAAVHAHDHGLL
ncbi:response regulator [Sphaerisporangium corydalis]|uniref:Response regulator n=1 Tax=Sphaerisporangium corydalis TaxID=1441875 RepID=A0ABV9E5M0_9ACTN|nr:response regulator transcription factor [Sphaerisporangium corydalis]